MRGRSNTEAPHQVADSTDLVDWVVKVLLCDRPPPHLAYEVLSEFGPGGDQVVDGSKRTSPDKWDEVHYVIEVSLPTACWRHAEYCSVTFKPDARDVGDDETRGFSRWRLLLTAALRRRAGVGGACLARGSVPQVTATQRMK